MRGEPVEPVVGDLGVAVQHDDVALAVQRDRAVDRRGETLLRRLLDERDAPALRELAHVARDLRLGRRVVHDDHLGGRAVGRREQRLEAAPGRLGAAVDRHDDVDDGHQPAPVSRRRAAPSGQRAHPAGVSR